MFDSNPELTKVAEQRLQSAIPNSVWNSRTRGSLIEAIEQLTELAKISSFYEKLLDLSLMCPDAEVQDAALRALQGIARIDPEKAEVVIEKCVALTHKAVEPKPDIREMAARILSGLDNQRFEKEYPRMIEDLEIAGSVKNCLIKLKAAS